MFDVIIAGARCAGSPTAMLLARQDYRVLLVDRSRFPSDIMRLHYIRQPGVALLQRWGLLDRIVAAGAPRIPLMTQVQDGSALTGTAWPIDGVVEAIGPGRRVLDQILVEGAVEAGAELREGFTVQEVVTATASPASAGATHRVPRSPSTPGSRSALTACARSWRGPWTPRCTRPSPRSSAGITATGAGCRWTASRSTCRAAASSSGSLRTTG